MQVRKQRMRNKKSKQKVKMMKHDERSTKDYKSVNKIE